MATKRADFRITEDGKFLCNEFQEGSIVDGPLPFSPDGSYTALANSLFEGTAPERFMYNSKTQELGVGELIEGDFADFDPRYYMVPHYDVSFVKNIGTLCKVFEPVLTFRNGSNGDLCALNFAEFRDVIRYLGGDDSTCKILIVEKRSRASWGGGASNNGGKLRKNYPTRFEFTSATPPRGSRGFILRVGNALKYSRDRPPNGGSRLDYWFDTFDNEDLISRNGKTMRDIIVHAPMAIHRDKFSVSGSGDWSIDRHFQYYSIVFEYTGRDPAGIGEYAETEHHYITRVAGNWAVVRDQDEDMYGSGHSNTYGNFEGLVQSPIYRNFPL